MTQDEIKVRNTALATYMGWIDTGNREDGEIVGWFPAADHPKGGQSGTGIESCFQTDMNLLMPVVWKLMASGFRFNQYVWDGSEYWAEVWDDHRPSKVCAVGESPALALWEAVSSLVMELQQKAV